MINNVLLLVGLWGMLFAGKPENAPQALYFITLNVVVMTSWGSLCFFVGGLRSLGDIISDGALEPMLATPRHPLVLAAGHQSHVASLGDVLMGLAGLVYIGFWAGPEFALRCLFAILISMLAFTSVFIAAGSVAFFVSRGAALSTLLLEMTLSLSVYPTGRMFNDWGRIVLLLTPSGVTAIAPMDWVMDATWARLAQAATGVLVLAVFAVWIFNRGVKNYRAVSLIGTKG